MPFVVLCPGTPEGSTGSGSGFKTSQKTGQRLKVSSDGFCIVPKYWALAIIYEEIIINIGCVYDHSHFEIIMSTIQNSHKDSNY